MSRVLTEEREQERVHTRKIPKTMRAAALDRFGGPEVLTIHELPVPEPDSNEVLIEVHTAGVVARWGRVFGGSRSAIACTAIAG